jgi:hypothetical protein
MDISTQIPGGPQPTPAKTFVVIVKVLGGQTFTIEVPSATSTIGDIKALAESTCKIPRQAQRLSFKGKALNDNETLMERGIPSSATLFLVKGTMTSSLSATTESSSSSTENQSAPPVAVPCQGGCGFFGSPGLDNYCSKCHKDKKDREQREAEALKAKIEEEKEAALKPIEFEDREEQVEKNRCWKCTKKIGLTGVRCRCGYFFCPSHRYAESHECDYDWKTNERRKLTKQNPVVQADKLSEKA